MGEYQRQEAIELLLAQTDVDLEEIEKYEDYALEAWLGELGYEWDEDAPMFGAWVAISEEIQL